MNRGLAGLVLVACHGAAEPTAAAAPAIDIAIAVGGAHTCVLGQDGGVQCFGRNVDHELGSAAVENSARPLAVPGVHGVAIAAGTHHTCVVTGDTTVACWGAGYGATPRLVNGLDHVVELVAAGDHACARRSDGRVACWGGGLGGPALHDVPGLAHVEQLVTGATHACARLTGGEVRCWGDNAIGQLGDGTRIARPDPVVAAGITAIAIAAGDGHTCAIGVDHLVHCWGDASPNPAAPVAWTVAGVADARQLAVGGRRSYARTAAGTIVRWDNDWRYDPASMPRLDMLAPPQPPAIAQVAGIAGASAVVAGPNHACARLAGTDIRCWGDDSWGQRGDGAASVQLAPVTVVGLHDVAGLALGGEHSCARLGDGTMWCWGSSHEAGQLGDGTEMDHPSPFRIGTFADVTHIALGNYHTCALHRGGALDCWGNAATFLLPAGNAAAGMPVPTPIVLGDPVLAVTTGGQRTCVRTAKGVACWDSGSRGPIAKPVELPGTTALAVTERHACAVIAGGAIACWGDNMNGALGDGTRTDAAAPTRVNGITGATQVAVGLTHSCALLHDATVACWGQNDFGQLGTGSTALSLVPVATAGLANVTQIGAGGWATCALRSNGSVLCWGANARGDRIATPTRVAGLTDAVELAVGYMHACARLRDNTVRCWGTNRSGQLGDGTSLQLDVPTRVVW